MGWPFPGSLLIVSLAALLFFGSAMAYKGRRRRIAQFGDPVILGLSRDHSSWAVASLLTSIAAFCIASALVLPPGGDPNPGSESQLGIVIDTQSLDRTVAADAVHAVLQQSPRGRVAIHFAGNAPEVAVPPTMDHDGALMVLIDRLAREGSAGRVPPTGRADHVVYISGHAPQQLDQFPGEFNADPGVAFVSQAGGDLQFGILNPEGELTWSASPRVLNEFLTRPAPRRRGFSLAWWALVLGFAFVALECIWEVIRP